MYSSAATSAIAQMAAGYPSLLHQVVTVVSLPVVKPVICS